MKPPIHPLYATRWQSPIGLLLLVAHNQALCGVWFDDQKGIPVWAMQAKQQADHPLLQLAVSQLTDYFAGKTMPFTLALDWSFGTAFQQRVWQALTAIPPGQTVSYGDIAREIGQPSAVRAVGGAVGHNPLGIVVPCHRVMGSNGALTGYTGGLTRKIALLELEARARASLL